MHIQASQPNKVQSKQETAYSIPNMLDKEQAIEVVREDGQPSSAKDEDNIGGPIEQDNLMVNDDR